jgi:hypothetical protein
VPRRGQSTLLMDDDVRIVSFISIFIAEDVTKVTEI